MNHELPPHLENEINNWYEGSIKKRLQEAICEVQAIGNNRVPNVDEVKETVSKCNKLILEASDYDEELYNDYKYRIFFQDQHYILVWGKEIDPDEP